MVNRIHSKSRTPTHHLEIPARKIRARGQFDPRKHQNVKAWVIKAIAKEGREPNDPLWKRAPTADDAYSERLRVVRFLRKHGKFEATATSVASRLEGCRSTNRCLSGACPECCRLFQRWFVRRSKRFIDRNLARLNKQLIAVSIVPADATARPGSLNTVSIENVQRRLKYAFDKANIVFALGGVDFSFNEDREGKYKPFWSIHHYIITSTANEKRLKGDIGRLFSGTREIPRPSKITQFMNNANRRSYALKMKFERRIGYDQIKERNGRLRKCRNTSRDKLRAKERLELLTYLDRIGLAARVIFRGARPVATSKAVLIESTVVLI